MRGETVDLAELKTAWQDTINPGWTHDGPHAEQLFRAVREANAKLSGKRALRLVLAGPPVDWSKVTGRIDLEPLARMRDSYPADVIQKEVVARGRRALLIDGFGHFMRRYPPLRGSDERPYSVVGELERHGVRVFSVFPLLRLAGDVTTLQPDVSAWAARRIALLKGTLLGAAPTKFYFPVLPPEFEADAAFDNLPMEEQFDAVLYLAERSALYPVPFPSALCDDVAYMKMRLARLELPGLREAEQLRQLCKHH